MLSSLQFSETPPWNWPLLNELTRVEFSMMFFLQFVKYLRCKSPQNPSNFLRTATQQLGKFEFGADSFTELLLCKMENRIQTFCRRDNCLVFSYNSDNKSRITASVVSTCLQLTAVNSVDVSSYNSKSQIDFGPFSERGMKVWEKDGQVLRHHHPNRVGAKFWWGKCPRIPGLPDRSVVRQFDLKT